jgi:hypothetical protein
MHEKWEVKTGNLWDKGCYLLDDIGGNGPTIVRRTNDARKATGLLEK